MRPDRSAVREGGGGERIGRDPTAAIVRFLERSTECAEVHQILDLLYDELAVALPFNRIGFARIRRHSGSVVCVWSRSDRPMTLVRDFEVELAGSSLECVLRERSPRIINDLEAYLLEHPGATSTNLIVQEGMQSSLICPLVAGEGDKVGFLFFSSIEKHAFNPSHADPLRQFGGLLASTLKNDRSLTDPCGAGATSEQRRQSTAGPPKPSRLELERFFELSLDLLCVAGMDGHFKVVNPSFARILGHTPEELLAKPFLDFVHPEDQSATVKQIAKLGSGQPILLFENRYRCKDGSYRWLEWTAMPVPEEDALYAVARDVTQHKEMDHRLRTVVESAPVAMILVDRADRIVLANRKMEAISGYDRDELIGQHAGMLLPRQYRQEYARIRDKLFATQGSRRLGSEGDLTALRKGDVEFPVEIELSAVDLDGPHLLCAVTDITERNKAMERVRKIVEASPDGILLVDVEGKIRMVNAAAERMFGYPRSVLHRKTLEFLLPERYRGGHQHHREAFLKQNAQRLMGDSAKELLGLSGEGKEFPVDVALKPIEIDGEKFIISTVRDLTERKKVEREFLVAQEVQQALLPATLPSIAGFDIAARARSAESTCGDFFGFVDGSGGSFLIAVGDVSGHGLGPAILTASVMSYLRAFTRADLSPGRILARTSDLLYEETRSNDFVTALVVRLDPRTRMLEFSNAGHPPGWVVDPRGRVKYELHGTGVPLGMFETTEYPSVASMLLKPGDTLVIITDGITEAESPDGTQFGSERTLNVIRENLGKSAAGIVDSLHLAIREFARGNRLVDDMTTVVIKVEERPSATPVNELV